MQHRINYSLRIYIMPIYIKKSASILKIQKNSSTSAKESIYRRQNSGLYFLYFFAKRLNIIYTVKQTPRKGVHLKPLF